MVCLATNTKVENILDLLNLGHRNHQKETGKLMSKSLKVCTDVHAQTQVTQEYKIVQGVPRLSVPTLVMASLCRKCTASGKPEALDDLQNEPNNIRSLDSKMH